MLQKPAFTLVAVLTLGLGIGANVSMYSWLDTRLRHLLDGVEHADRIVALNTTYAGRADRSISYPTFADLRDRRPASVEDLIAYTLAPLNMRAGNSDPERVFGEFVSGNYFTALGVRPRLGRAFLPEEGVVQNRDAVAVISDKFWIRRFNRDPAIVGRAITLNGMRVTIVGVGPEGFHGTEPYSEHDLWVPVMLQPALSGVDRLTRGNRWLEVMVSLKPGVTLARAEADLDLVMRGLGQTYAEDAGSGVKLYELWRAPSMGGAAVTAVMGVQLGVAGIVLLIACANVANLLLASAATRQRETAGRLTLGAQPRPPRATDAHREHAARARGWDRRSRCSPTGPRISDASFIPPAPLPIEINTTLNGGVFAFAGAVTIMTAVIFGVVPADAGRRLGGDAGAQGIGGGGHRHAAPRARS